MLNPRFKFCWEILRSDSHELTRTNIIATFDSQPPREIYLDANCLSCELSLRLLYLAPATIELSLINPLCVAYHKPSHDNESQEWRPMKPRLQPIGRNNSGSESVHCSLNGLAIWRLLWPWWQPHIFFRHQLIVEENEEMRSFCLNKGSRSPSCSQLDLGHDLPPLSQNATRDISKWTRQFIL